MRTAGKQALFQLSSMELELNFVVKSSSEVKGGFDLKIVSLGSKLAEAGEEVQKITVKFSTPPTKRSGQNSPVLAVLTRISLEVATRSP